ncbi:MAG: polysaccharide deacetylase family protein [Thermoleophilia bacterium]|nr:polysaccharide deacetylase family protein [Thermoleophilia bacterium]
MYPRHSPVLCYHALSSSWSSTLAIPPELLAEQVRALAGRGYIGLTLAEAERRRAERTLPRRSVVVTFDDGYASTSLAKPALDEVGFPATVFVVTRFADSGELLSWPGIDHWVTGEHAEELRPLRWDDLERLVAAGWEVGSHTVSHPRLPELPDGELAAELEQSRAMIVARLGRCDTLAYPYGLADSRVARAASRAGYVAAVTLTASHRVDSPYLRARTGLYAADSGLRLRLKLSPAVAALRRTPLADLAEGARSRSRGAGRRERP